MKKWLIALAGIVLVVAATSYGLTAISYTFIPPEHGYFRDYQNIDMHRREMYWQYWKCWGPIIGWISPRQNMSSERWELVRDTGHRYFIYDERNECDGTLTFTRTEMILRHLDGSEKHYSRVLNLWEILTEYRKAEDNKTSFARLAPRRDEHEQCILARMKERNINIRPDAVAQRRPPVIAPPVSNTPSMAPTPVFAVTEFGYHNNTGTVFVLYADGTVICSSLPDDPAAPFRRFHVPDAAQFLKELSVPNYDQLPGEIRVFEATDQTTTRLWTPKKTVEVYGPWREPPEWDGDTDSDRETNARIKLQWKSKVAGIRPMLQKIDELRKRQGEAWFPPKIEVTFWDYEHARDKPVEWPSNWPGLYDVTSKKDGGIYRVYVPSDDFPELTAFLDSCNPSGAVMIDLNQMSPSMRFPFPGEEAWLAH